MARVIAVRKFVEPTARANEGMCRLVLYSTRRRRVQATVKEAPAQLVTAGGVTHEERSHEQHT
jgi:hypothetical protein